MHKKQEREFLRIPKNQTSKQGSSRMRHSVAAWTLAYCAFCLGLVGAPSPSIAGVAGTTPFIARAKFVNVTDYGAQGNGSADDAPAIQQAIDAVAEGGVVYLPAGTYLLGTSAGGVETFPDGSPIQSALIVGKNNIVIKGAGAGSSTVLQLMPNTKMRTLSVTASGVIVERLIVDGNKEHRDGSVPWPGGDVVDALVYGSSQSSYVTIRFCTVRNGIEDGIGLWQSPNAYVHDCTSEHNGTPQAGAVGIAISGTNSSGARLTNNVIRNNSSAGLWLAFGSSHITVESNLIEHNQGAGITTGGDNPATTVLSHNISITNNIVRENGAAGFPAVSIYSAQGGTISGNAILDNMFDGLTFHDQGSIPSSDWQVTSNTCANTNGLHNQDVGIRVIGLSQGITLNSNVCKDNGTSINDQIVIENEAAVNSDWKEVNTMSYM